MNQVIVELNTATQAYNEAMSLHHEYMDAFMFMYDLDDDGAFDALAQLDANKSINLGLSALRQAKTNAENKAIELLTQTINVVEIDGEAIKEASDILVIANKNWKIRQNVLEVAIEFLA